MFCYYGTMLKRYLVPIAWLLALAVAVLAVVAWRQALPLPADQLTVYSIFPVFGLLAFSLMWTHYIVGALRLYTGVDRSKLDTYYDVTAATVLASLLLHPGLLTWQTWRDQLGLPLSYVAPDLRLYVIIGAIAWLVFLAFEFKRVYGERSWWHFIDRANELAMVGIFVHGYFLGKALLPSWFVSLWLLYAITFAIAVGYDAYKRHQKTKSWL